MNVLTAHVDADACAASDPSPVDRRRSVRADDVRRARADGRDPSTRVSAGAHVAR